MSRPLRIEYPNAWYHVMNRGRRGEDIFIDNKDCDSFIALLQETSEMFNLRVSAYCLMSNHYHLLVQTPLANLARSMRHVNGVYTQRYNRRKNYDGQLFRGRYKSIHVEEESHLLELLRYIHRNPVRAKMCSSVKEYTWSSHHGYISSGKKWDWLNKDVILGMFSRNKSTAKKEYRAFVENVDDENVLAFFSKKNVTSFFGSKKFLKRVRTEYGSKKEEAEVPESKQLAPTIGEIKEVVSAHYGLLPSDLEYSRRGHMNEPRNVAIYLARKRSGLPLKVIGGAFGLQKYSSVSSIVTRMEKALNKNKQLGDRIKTIKRELP